MSTILQDVTKSPHFEWALYMVFEDADGNLHVVTELDASLESCSLADHEANVGPLLRMITNHPLVHCVDIGSYRRTGAKIVLVEGVYQGRGVHAFETIRQESTSLTQALAAALLELP